MPKGIAMLEEAQPSNAAAPPGRSHYGLSYLGNELQRLASYRMQLRLALRTSPKTCLLVGRGDGLVDRLLTAAGVATVSLDVVPELEPDVVGSVDAIPLEDDCFDLCICCQVLEHLPFERFGHALRELRRVSRGRLVLSLPDQRRCVTLRINAPRLSRQLQWSPPRMRAPRIPADRLETDGHHWEIGFRGWEMPIVRRSIEEAGWRIRRISRVPELSWHTFFDCESGA